MKGNEEMSHIETERKLIILKPDEEILLSQKDFTESKILQIYLENGTLTHRVRLREYSDGRIEYTENKKKRISALSAIEEEREISKEEFEALSRNVEKGASPLRKMRRTFSLSGLIYELDYYGAWEKTCILEVEIPSESEEINIPPFITVLKDVTGDKRYSNHSMSHNFPKEDA